MLHNLRECYKIAPMIEIPPYEIHSIITGHVRLDGGAMFGVVPKVLWDKVCDVDEHNRILLATRTLIAIDRKASRLILVDTGCGTKWDPIAADRFAIRYDENAIPNALANLDLSTDDVTDIIITHLHFDHNGGLTQWYDEPGEATTLRYPKAIHWLHRKHFDHASHPHTKDKASFIKADFAALARADNLRFLEGNQPESSIDGLSWWVSHGHTPFQLHPIFGNDSKRLIFCGDIIPTIAHLRLTWVMAYDLRPTTTIAEKEWINGHGVREGWILTFPHDPTHGGVAIDGTAARPVVSNQIQL